MGSFEICSDNFAVSLGMTERIFLKNYPKPPKDSIHALELWQWIGEGVVKTIEKIAIVAIAEVFFGGENK